MLIGIDGNEANVKDRVGVPQYAYELLWGMYRLKSEWKSKHKVVIYLRSLPRADLPKASSHWQYKVLPGRGIWILTRLMPHLFVSRRPDVFFAPNHYLPVLPPMPKVCTIHDLGYLKFSGQFKKYDFWQLKYWSAISIFISKYIISVSKSSKQNIVRHYPFASKKIKVAYHGYDKTRFNNKISSVDVRRVKKKYGIKNDYILFLSTLKPSKNVEGLLKAFKLLITDNALLKTALVIAGKKGWLYKSIFEKVKDLNIEKRVIFTDFIDEDDKPALYFGAKVFVSPSFWEGFGIHVLEAMACGTPVVVSRVASLPEVAGKTGIYVDANSRKSIARGIKKVINMTAKEYNELAERSIRQAEKFTWEDTARKTIEVLEKAGGYRGYK